MTRTRRASSMKTHELNMVMFPFCSLPLQPFAFPTLLPNVCEWVKVKQHFHSCCCRCRDSAGPQTSRFNPWTSHKKNTRSFYSTGNKAACLEKTARGSLVKNCAGVSSSCATLKQGISSENKILTNGTKVLLMWRPVGKKWEFQPSLNWDNGFLNVISCIVIVFKVQCRIFGKIVKSKCINRSVQTQSNKQ